MTQETLQETYMKRCIDLARSGLGNTAPNPLVGSVIVYNNKIIGEGFHEVFGGPHAEVNAINSVEDKSLLRNSVLYVNLEPCSHTGKTPPCADTIINHGIPEVVIGTTDPNPLVSGNGIKKLKNAGVFVTVKVLEKQCLDLNKRFITYHLCQRPYIILKWAQTCDGFIDVNRDGTENLQPTWISNDISRMLVHKWRSEEQAILIGTHTAAMDNPRLNVREWEGRSPIRMIIDRNLTLKHNLHIFDNTSPTIIFNAVKEHEEGQTKYVRLDFNDHFLKNLLDYLYDTGVQSVFVEGGRMLLESLIKENLWDEARVFEGLKKFGSGIPAPVMPDECKPEKYCIREDVLKIYKNGGTNLLSAVNILADGKKLK
ncbi:MAG TPA: bifunctional diaminohydroxyphosphoribosylaminopyrimidine deaminase/5-amino-6-(5-phosphoribosylamino)uracil reductase RibD [Bacteroidales bacterium]|nr:bifunctional diaminohydroxyphosphoribosylaminopyrimidine deaminase/5-amino-6-(5-phosphoribosylamino)uracil reductase RibD [Bacteroidales bacterium]